MLPQARRSTPDREVTQHILDRPVWHALATRQARFAVGDGAARRFAGDIGPLAGVRDESDESLNDLARLLPHEGVLALFANADDPLPSGAFLERGREGVQMVATARFGEQSAEGLLALGDDDAPEMLVLALLTEPGPFAAGTHRLSQFWGIRENGRLVAMAGERLQLTGYSEVSGVCTHPDHRGRGHAVRLLKFVAAQIEARGETPILHSYAANTGALKLYETLGFETRRSFTFKFVRRN
ncbi:MAG: GNAT family N-acetyltransferase [Sphingomonadales bacterium]